MKRGIIIGVCLAFGLLGTVELRWQLARVSKENRPRLRRSIPSILAAHPGRVYTAAREWPEFRTLAP